MDPETTLDRALSGHAIADEEIASLAQVGARLETSFQATSPSARAQRALFVQAVARPRPAFGWLRLTIPSLALAMALVLLGFASRSSLPGQALYPVRNFLSSVGLSPSATEEIDRAIQQAASAVSTARGELDADPAAASALSTRAIETLGQARKYLRELDVAEAKADAARMDRIEADARAVIARAEEASHPAPAAPSDHSGRPDSTGDNGDSSGSSDNSGPGSSGSGDSGSSRSGDSRSSGSGDSASGSSHSGSSDKSGGSGSSDSGDSTGSGSSDSGSATDTSGSSDGSGTSGGSGTDGSDQSGSSGSSDGSGDNTSDSVSSSGDDQSSGESSDTSSSSASSDGAGS